jgi:hypothetical protein
MRKLGLLALLIGVPLGLFAARLTLRDGTVVFGQFISGNEQTITFQDDGGVRRRFDTNQVQLLDFTQVANTANRAYDNSSNNNYPNRAEDRRFDRDWTVLPAGTQISVRTDQSINSENAAAGRTFPATLIQDVIDRSGNVVIPRGSQATLIVREVNEGGTLNGGSFVLDLDSLRVNGRRYIVNTTDLETRDRNGIGKNKRTGEMVGGGAVLGTLLGAIAGGGKGAAIGAIAGAAAGGGVQVLTKGREIRVPAETVLNFRLEEPLHLREG